MSIQHNIDYRGKKVKITVSNTGQGKYVGTFIVEEADPPVRGTGADATSEEGALDNAVRKAKEVLDTP